MSKKKFITCGNCPYFTGVQCHGHGEFWGECSLLEFLIRYFKLQYKGTFYDIQVKKSLFYKLGYLGECSHCAFLNGRVSSYLSKRRKK